MSLLSPKPNIVRIFRRLEAPPRLAYALVQDTDGRLWIEQKCPVGTQYWTVAQAACLPRGTRTGLILRELIRQGRRMEAVLRLRTNAARTGQRMTTRENEALLPRASRRERCASTRSSKPRETVAV